MTAQTSAVSRILIVEDENSLGATLQERLLKEGYDVELVENASDAKWQITHGRPFHLMLLDVGLPDGTGFDVAFLARKTHPQTALVFLTAHAAPEERVRGLELGAEDYITKPFHLKELLLRVRNALKRARFVQSTPEMLSIGRAQVYFSRYEVLVDGAAHVLGQKECALLKLLAERRGQVVSRDEILDTIWDEDEYPSTRTIDNFIVKLRRIVEERPDDPALIRSVRGVGYQLL